MCAKHSQQSPKEAKKSRFEENAKLNCKYKDTVEKVNVMPGVTADCLIRLHITPLTPEIAPTLIPSSLFPDPGSHPISYHTIPTFPENNYGYVDLSKDAAEKLKKKLNGAVFRGVKVRVEEARDRWVPPMEIGLEINEEGTQKAKRNREKGKKEDSVYEGYVLPNGRWVKRAWTKIPVLAPGNKARMEKGADKRTKNKGEVKKGDCLFKIRLPENIHDDSRSKKRKKDDKDDGESKKEKKRSKKREKVVKEFTNAAKFPQFLKGSALSGTQVKAVKFVEGMGWVNEHGEMVDDSIIKRRADVERQMVLALGDASRNDVEVRGSEERSSALSFLEVEQITPIKSRRKGLRREGKFNGKVDTVGARKKESAVTDIDTFATPDSETGSENDDKGGSNDKRSKDIGNGCEQEGKHKKDEYKLEATENIVHSMTPSLKIKIPSPHQVGPAVAHPLEILFKPSAVIENNAAAHFASNNKSSGFEFALSEEDEDGEIDAQAEEEVHEPTFSTPIATPYNNRYRSAAPTPDTAIGSKLPPWHDDYDKFEPTTPIPPKVLSYQAKLQRIDEHTNYDAPLLFPHTESRFLASQSVFAMLPKPKALTERLVVGVEENKLEEQKPKNKKGKTKSKRKESRDERVEAAVATLDRKVTSMEIWKEKFYHHRGEWNREYRKRRREALKMQRRRKRKIGKEFALGNE